MSITELLSSLPKRIKIGSLTYTTNIVDGLQSEGEKHWGLCDFDTVTIHINSQPPSAAHLTDTVIHELVHAIWEERGLGKRAAEEQAVQAIGAGVTGLLQDNPKLMTWIRKALRK